jgi:hypothetical protein
MLKLLERKVLTATNVSEVRETIIWLDFHESCGFDDFGSYCSTLVGTLQQMHTAGSPDLILLRSLIGIRTH